MYSRYKFVDWNGNQCGIKNTDDLKEAIQTAIDFHLEIIDTQTTTENQIVFSGWDGWNADYDFYDKNIIERVIK